MPGPRTRKKKQSPAQRGQRAPRIWGVRRWKLVFSGVFCLGLVLLIWSWWRWDQEEAFFQRAATQSKGILSRVESLAHEGNEHVPQGAPVSYQTDLPASGSHYPVPTSPGFYESPQLPGNLVHALEHGNIVIYYDRPGPETMRTLKEWAGHYSDPWAGLVVAPKQGFGRVIILTAWMKRLRLDEFDPNASAAFIDLFRGRGPERRVR